MSQQLINLLHTEAVFLRGMRTTKRPDYRKRFECAAKDIRGQINSLIRSK